ncbi:MAG TPA: ribosome biogenesis/translation initiation ATPase RLI [Thermoplasmata archaeon]|nr:ribosome biogenesis/translation initiation ATPase RLI [Thermoplasmata archaeon]
MRVAVLFRDRCQPKQCGTECVRFCPRVRAGVVETIRLGDRGKPVISEDLCIGCGICVHKCPFDAIRIVGLSDELDTALIHQYGENGFRLFRLPTIQERRVVGLLGSNGIGKTTVLNIMAGNLIPNMGDLGGEPSWDRVLERFRGTHLHAHFSAVASGKRRIAVKPQYVDRMGRVLEGAVGELMESADERGALDDVAEMLGLHGFMGSNVRDLSGGELQRMAIAATMLKDADVYMFDEPSSYLDIHQRMRAANAIRTMVDLGQVLVIEHDLAILDFISDLVYVMYGQEATYGIVAEPRSVRNAVNAYLQGYLREENIRFRDDAITFDVHPPREEWGTPAILTFGPLEKRFEGFHLVTDRGVIHEGEVVGVVGPNATGKTTLAKILAGVLEPTRGKVDASVTVSYKPQYIAPDFEGTVREYFYTVLGDFEKNAFFNSEIRGPLRLDMLMTKPVPELSGGELQRVAIAGSIARDADLYLLDEPSAYLDANERMVAAKTVRRVMEKKGRSALIVDHDIYLIDLISDSLLVFEGVPSVEGRSVGPLSLHEGMNRFLASVGITFRRDPETGRPRINTPGSRLDRQQRSVGEYYYAGLIEWRDDLGSLFDGGPT